MVSMLTNLKVKVMLDEITSDLREVNFRLPPTRQSTVTP